MDHRSLRRELRRAPGRVGAGVAALGAMLLLAAACASDPPVEDEWAQLAPADELYEQGVAELESGRKVWLVDTTDYAAAIDHFQDIIDNYPYSEYAVLAELRIADAYFEQALYEEALSYYQDFADLHPDHEQVPYTIYRAALSHVNRSRDALRDQTATTQAITQIDRLLRDHPYSSEASEADRLARRMRARLGENVMRIGDFYLEREEWQSAANRYRSVLNEYPGLGLDAEALYKLAKCYGELDRADEAMRMFQVILENYEGSYVAAAAEELIPAAN